MLKFKDVPETFKHPAGPYRQAPAEFGGEWWLVDLASGETPWLTEAHDPKYPDGFLLTFGPRPVLANYRGLRNPRAAFEADKNRWEQDLRFTKQYGWPDWDEVTAATVEAVKQIAAVYDMGEPRPYLGRYDWRVRFPESKIQNFETSVFGVLHAFHQDVARYQSRLLQDFDYVPSPRHPWVPSHLWPAK